MTSGDRLYDPPTQEQHQGHPEWGVRETTPVEEPGRPCPIPLAWLPRTLPDGRSAPGRSPDLYRQLGCSREGACLRLVIRRGWRAFGCALCPHATEDYLEPRRARESLEATERAEGGGARGLLKSRVATLLICARCGEPFAKSPDSIYCSRECYRAGVGDDRQVEMFG